MMLVSSRETNYDVARGGSQFDKLTKDKLSLRPPEQRKE